MREEEVEMITGTIDLRDKKVTKIMIDIEKARLFLNKAKMFVKIKGFYAEHQRKIHQRTYKENKFEELFPNTYIRRQPKE